MSDAIAHLVARLDQVPYILPNEQVIWQPLAATPEAIAQVQDALGLPIGGALREFLLLRGGGGLKSLPISGVDPLRPLARNRGLILGDTLHWRARGMPASLIAIQRDAADQAPVCAQATDGSENSPIVRYAHGQIEPVADDFTAYYAQSHERVFRQAGL